MEILLTVLHIFVSVVLILSILLQSGKGGGMGAALGGASAQVFGGRGFFFNNLATILLFAVVGTILTLVHEGWENYEDDPFGMGANHDKGWDEHFSRLRTVAS